MPPYGTTAMDWIPNSGSFARSERASAESDPKPLAVKLTPP